MKLRLRLLPALLLITGLMVAPTHVRADQNNAGLDDLFTRLFDASDPHQARGIEETIWSIWISHEDKDINQRMATGITAMNGGAMKLSLSIFDEIVQRAPTFAEAWNKRATVYYMLGEYEASVRDIQKTLALEPHHFGALSGMGLIYDAIGKEAAALKVWQKALSINPHMHGIKDRVRELQRKIEGEAT